MTEQNSVSLPSRDAATVLEQADDAGVTLDEFDPADASDLYEGMVVSTSRDPADASLVVIGDVFEGDDGRDYVTYRVAGYEATDGTRTTLVASFVSRVAYENEWVIVPHSARTDDGTPYRCFECGKFAYVHEGVEEAFAAGGCDACGAIFTHDLLVREGVVVELLL